MKKYILSFALLGVYLVWSCRPKEFTDPYQIVPFVDDTILLRNISVKGAIEIKIDHEKNIIQITLPEPYTSEFIDLDFTLEKGGFLNYYDFTEGQKTISNTNNPQKPSYRFIYAGNRPLNINVQKEFGLYSKSYVVYVNQNSKKLQAEIERIDSVYSFPSGTNTYKSVGYFYLKITNSNGTFPNNPNKESNYALLKEQGGIKADTIFLSYGQTKFWFDVEKYIPFENKKFSLELVTNNSRQILKENIVFIRQKPDAYYNNFGIYGISRSLKVEGGIFLSKNKYSFRFSNDFLEKNIEIDAQFDDVHNLSASLLSLPIGGYIIEILENGMILSKGVINIGKTASATAIRAIKKDNNNTSGNGPSTKKEQLNQGETFSILPEYFFASCYGIGISQEKLDNIEAPSLKFTNSLQEIILTPKKIIVWWAVATCNVVYFQYTIPKSTESGFYEAQLVYPDGRESLKYWNKIEIR